MLARLMTSLAGWGSDQFLHARQNLPFDGEPPIPPMPPGFSVLDDTPSARGFVPLAEAARTMGLGEEKVLAMCGRELRAFQRQDGAILVQPAVVTTIGSVSVPATDSTPPEAA